MAQFVKRGKGWQTRIQWRDGDQRRTKSKGGFTSKRLAQKWALKNETKLSEGVKIDKQISLSDYYQHWYETYKKPKISRVSKVFYHTIGRYINSYFKNTLINNITRSDYQNFINHYGANHAPSSVQKCNGFIRACVKSAILDDYLTKDFTDGVTLVANKSRILKVQYLSLSEIKRLISMAENGLRPDYKSRYMILTAIYTGMRLSEIQALTWHDIDLLHGTININKSWDAVAKKFKATKNESSVRKIPINLSLIILLKQVKAVSTSTMVFMTSDGTVPTSNAVNKALRRLLAKAHIKKANFHFHSLRHSHVALLLANGIDIYAISKRLGHSNITTTANVYAYLIDEYKEQSNQHIIKALESL